MDPHIELFEVKLHLRAEKTPNQLDVDRLYEIRANLTKYVPNVRVFRPQGIRPAFNFSVGVVDGLEMMNDDGSIDCLIHANSIEVRWRKMSAESEYVGYDALEPILIAAMRAGSDFTVCAISYNSLVRCLENESITNYINLPITFDPKYLVEYNVARNFDSELGGVEFRVQTSGADPTTWALLSSCGTPITVGALDQMRESHVECNRRFRDMLTDTGHTAWKL